MSLPKLNERLISKVLDHIKAFPETYNQNIVSESCDITKRTPCGAIGCFGGWAVLLGMAKSKRHDAALNERVDLNDAQELLGFTEEEADYVFDIADGDPKQDFKTVKARLANVREARVLVAKVQKALSSVPKGVDGVAVNDLVITTKNHEFNLYQEYL